MARIVVSPRADRDLDEQFAYIARDSRHAAVRFLAAAEETFEQLATMPELGARFHVSHSGHSHLAGLRVWQIQGFEKYLIFYCPIEQGVEIVRVLHGARDIAAIFEQEKD